MANKDDYLTDYRQFFEEFANTVEPNDQLPVKLGSYKFINSEVVGGIIDWCLQYLTRKSCPSTLIGPLIKITIDEIRQQCKKHPVACGFNPSENVYEPLKLMQTVMSKINEICLRYLDNSQLDTLPVPSSVLPPSVSVCATRNTRRRMEDRHVVIHDINGMFNIADTSPSSYYAVFDGHAGPDAAAYSAAHLHQFLVESEFYPTDPERALKEAFLRTDEFFLEKSKIENFRSGTTAVCALLRPKEETLYVAWVGDSQALLVNRGKVLQIVKPHKPCREDEKDRIEANGGCVMFWGMWRVNGQLAVSRAIGDLKLKPYVTAEPDIVAVPLDGNEEFLIIACDGLWDYVSEDDAAITVYKRIKENPENIDSIAESLTDLAKQEGSRDNISVIVIFLKDPSKIAKKLSTDWAWTTTTTPGVNMDGVDNTNINNTASNNAFDLFDVFQKRGNLDHFAQGEFKPNGTDPKKDLYMFDRPSNGKRSADEFDEEEDDFGPETDIDAVDDVLLSPMSKLEGNGNGEKMDTLDVDLEVQRQQSSVFEPVRQAREETPTPPADSVLDSSGVADNVAESEDSDDEWNYYRVDPKEKENIASTVETIEKVSEELATSQDEMSNLNPDAKEFVPVSPTRVAVSPVPYPRDLTDDTLIAQSPRRAVPMDINVPSPVEFQFEVKQRPSEIFEEFDREKTENQNGHQLSSQEIMQNLLNGKDVSEIEFHPQNFPKTDSDDVLENNIINENLVETESTKEIASPSTENPTESSLSPLRDEQDFSFVPKPQDPMSMSFYQDKDEQTGFSTNPFDLNKVQLLPENVDEFLQPTNQTEASFSPAQSPLGIPLAKSPVQSAEEVELVLSAASPIESPSPLLEVGTSEIQEIEAPKLEMENKSLTEIANSVSPVCEIARSPIFEPADSPVCQMAKSPLLEPAMTPEICELAKSPVQEACEIAKSPVQEACEIAKSPIQEIIEIAKSPIEEICEIAKSPIEEICEIAKSPIQEICDIAKSPIPEICEIAKSPIQEICDIAKSPELCEIASSPFEVAKTPEIPQSPVCEIAKTPEECQIAKSPLLEAAFSPDVCEIAKSPLLKSESPICDIATSPILEPVISPEVCEIAKSPVPEICDIAKSPILKASKTPDICQIASSLIMEVANEIARSPFVEEAKSAEVCEVAKSPILEVHSPMDLASPIGPLSPKSPIPELTGLVSPDITASIKDENISGELSEVAKTPLQEEVNTIEELLKEAVLEAQEVKVADQVEDIIQEVLQNVSNVSTLESVAPSEMNSFLERSHLPDITSPLSPVNEIEKFQTEVPESWKQNLEIKCETIQPEFPVHTMTSPSEESKGTDTPPPISAVVLEEPQLQPKIPEVVEIIPEVKTTTKTSKTTSKVPPTKKPLTSKTSPTSPSKPLPSKPSATAIKRTSTTPAKTSTTPAKTTTTATKTTPKPKPPTPTASPRTSTTRVAPKTTTLASKPLEKKPLTNGDVKPAAKTTLIKKTTTTTSRTTTTAKIPTSTTSTASRPNSVATSKPSVPRTSATNSTASRPATTAAAAPKPRPTGLTAKTTTAAATTKTASTKPPTTGTARSTTTTARPKPLTTSLAPKPRVPATSRPITKAPDTEKQIKETANKQLSASRTTSKTTATAARPASYTTRKIDNKPSLTAKTTSRTTTTTTTLKPTTKKPPPITRKTVTKTVAEQNGVVSVIQEITTTIVNDEPQLIKDNSPVDNLENDNSKLVELAD